MKVFLTLGTILFIGCASHNYNIKLDPQLYTANILPGQKLRGLIYVQRNSLFSSFNKDEIYEQSIIPTIRRLSGNKIVPLRIYQNSGSVKNQTQKKVKQFLLKGLIVHDLND